MSRSQTLNCRCGVATFKERAKPLLDIITERSKNDLREAGILQLFSIQDIKQNIPLLSTLLRSYSTKNRAFLVGNVYVKFTANHVALMLGMPNRGVEFDFQRRPFSSFEQKDLVAEIDLLGTEQWSEVIEKRRVDTLVKYVLCKFFFPLKVLKIPTCIQNFGGLEEFRRYNWPKTVEKFMQGQFNMLSRKACRKGLEDSIGYLEGCSVLLVVWFLEITKVTDTFDDLARPRLSRWSSKTSISAKYCMSLKSNLKGANKVSTAFENVLPSEKQLLGVQDDEFSDFENNSKEEEVEEEVEDKEEEDEKEESIEKHIMRFVSSRLGKINAVGGNRRKEKKKKESKELKRKEMEKVIERECKKTESEMDSRIRKCIDEVRHYVDDEVLKLRRYCDERFDALTSKNTSSMDPTSGGEPSPDNQLVIASPLSSLPYLPSPRPLRNQKSVDESSLIKGIKGRPNRKKKVIFSPSVGVFSFPGRALVSANVKSVIDRFMVQFKNSSDILFERGNLVMHRSDIEELIGSGWLSDVHLDTYSLFLDMENTLHPSLLKPFLYISPIHAQYKKASIRNTKSLLKHITLDSVKYADMLLLPIHLDSHWALLVGNMKDEVWEFYDSLPGGRHLRPLDDVLKCLFDDVGDCLPEKVIEWPIQPVCEAPTQDNGNDCGVFVLMYMKTVLSRANTCWSRKKGWAKKMPAFRAEIAAEIIKTFCSLKD